MGETVVLGAQTDFLDLIIETMGWKSGLCGNRGMANRSFFSIFRSGLVDLITEFTSPQVGKAQVRTKRTWRAPPSKPRDYGGIFVRVWQGVRSVCSAFFYPGPIQVWFRGC